MVKLTCSLEEIRQKEALHKGIPLSPFSFGQAHPDKNFYVIWRQPPGSGFFSNVFHVLSHVLWAQQLDMIPIVDMKNFKTFYNEIDSIHGTYNAWEYYYKPLSVIPLEEVYTSKNVYFCNGICNFQIYQNMFQYTNLIHDFLMPQEYILRNIETFFNTYFKGNKVLGVHFRGQEMKRASQHPTPPTKKQIQKSIDSMLDTYPIDKIFVVTEEQSYLDFLTKRYKDKIIYTDYFRTYGENAYNISKNIREQHMFKLGQEVMIDTYLLSYADYFVAGGQDGFADGSNVSRMAQLLRGEYDDTRLIYNGVNKDYVQYFARLHDIYFKLKRMLTLC